jgi:hypothetical protein
MLSHATGNDVCFMIDKRSAREPPLTTFLVIEISPIF